MLCFCRSSELGSSSMQIIPRIYADIHTLHESWKQSHEILSDIKCSHKGESDTNCCHWYKSVAPLKITSVHLNYWNLPLLEGVLGGSSFHKGRCNLLSSHVWHWLSSLAMQMKPVAAGIIWCPVNTAHEVKILSSNACQTGCGIKETCDLLCRYCIYRSDLPAANHPWQPCLANFKILLRSLSEAAWRQKANHCIKVICFYGLILHTYEDLFLVCGWICWWICLLLL